MSVAMPSSIAGPVPQFKAERVVVSPPPNAISAPRGPRVLRIAPNQRHLSATMRPLTTWGGRFMAIWDSVDVDAEGQPAQADLLRAVLADQQSTAELRAALDSELGYDPGLHAQLTSEFGLAGWTIPVE